MKEDQREKPVQYCSPPNLGQVKTCLPHYVLRDIGGHRLCNIGTQVQMSGNCFQVCSGFDDTQPLNSHYLNISWTLFVVFFMHISTYQEIFCKICYFKKIKIP